MKGEWTIPANVIKDYFNEMAKDNTHHTVFPAGNVQSKDQFIEFCQNPRNMNCFILSAERLGGHAWINGIEDGRCMVHFSSLKWVRGPLVVKLGKDMIKWWFSLPDEDGNPLIYLMIGMIPSRNKRAQQFVKSLDFVKVGEVPQMMKDFYHGDRDGLVIHYRLSDARR